MRGLSKFLAGAATLAMLAGVSAQAQDNSRINPQAEFEALRRGESGGGAPPVAADRKTQLLAELDRELSRSGLPTDTRVRLLYIRSTIYMFDRRYEDASRDDREILRLRPAMLADVVSLRATMFANNGDLDRAFRTIDGPIERQPDNGQLRSSRARVRLIAGEPDRAIEDAIVAMEAGGAESLSARRLRAHAYLAKGAFDAALADFDALMVAAPAATDQRRAMQRLELLLWRYVAQAGLRRDPRQALAAEMKTMNLFQMPGPVAKYLVGQSTAAELEAIAATDKEAQGRGAACTVPFFMAVETLRRGDRSRARDLFRTAADRCPVGRYESWTAKGYLQRLG